MAKARKKFDSDLSGKSFSQLFQESMNDIINPKDLPEQVLIPTGVELFDTIIGGGILTGTYTSFAAPSGSGKSTFCINAESQFKKLYPEGFIIHIDSEQCTSDNRLISLGVPLGKDDRIYKVSFGATVEEVFKFIQNFIAIKEKYATEVDPSYRAIPTMMVWDSVDASPTEKAREVDSSEQVIGQKPKQLNFFISKFLRDFRKYNIAFVTVNHITPKLKMMGPYEPYDGGLAALKNFTISGGKPVIYYPSNLIFLRGRENTKVVSELITNKYHLDSAFIVEASTLKCKNFSYNMTVELVFDTMRGFDNFTTKLHNMYQSDWFVAEGRSFLLRNYPDFKFKIEDCTELYKTDETFKNKFDATWNDYIEERYGKFKQILAQIANDNKHIDISGMTEKIDISVLKELANDATHKSTDEDNTDLREAIFEEANSDEHMEELTGYDPSRK